MTDSNRVAHRDIAEAIKDYSADKIMQALIKPSSDVEFAYLMLLPTSPLVQMIQARENEERNFNILLRDLHDEQMMRMIRQKIEEVAQLLEQQRQADAAMTAENAKKRGETEKAAAGNASSEELTQQPLGSLFERIKSVDKQLEKLMEERAQLSQDWVKNRENFVNDYLEQLKQKMPLTPEQEDKIRKIPPVDIVAMLAYNPELAKHLDMEAKAETKEAAAKGVAPPTVPVVYKAAAAKVDVVTEFKVLATVAGVAKNGEFDPKVLLKAMRDHNLGAMKPPSSGGGAKLVGRAAENVIAVEQLKVEKRALVQAGKGLEADAHQVPRAKKS